MLLRSILKHTIPNRNTTFITTRKHAELPKDHWFSKLFGEHLLLTNTVSSAIMMCAGDLVQQEIEYRRSMLMKRYDWMRASRMLAVGIVLGPMHHYFYKYLNVFIPGTDIKAISKKILADQLIMAPSCTLTFFYCMGFLEGKSFSERIDEIKKKFATVYMVDWILWPPIQYMTFYFIAPNFQAMFANFLTMCFDVFLSYMKHLEVAEENRKAIEKEKYK